MKTKFKFASLFALLLTLFSFAPKNLSAQCPVIRNYLPCSVTVQVDFFSLTPSGCNQPCGNPVILNINPYDLVPINCNVCPQFCNVQVTILTIGGAAAGGSADISVRPPGNALTGGGPGCFEPSNGAIFYTASAQGTFRIVPL